MGLFDVLSGRGRAKQPEPEGGDAHDLITFFDVETPNRKNDRMCSIGLVQTDWSGDVIESASFLVDPEEPFDDVNMSINGLSPIAVRGARTFPELWNERLMTMMSDSLLVAHNARFDLAVVAKSMADYGFGEPSFTYADTLVMSRRRLAGCTDYKLPTVCHELGVGLDHHHDATSDADACREIFWSLVSPEEDVASLFEPYVLGESNPYRSFRRKDFCRKTEEMRGLVDLARSTLLDGVVSAEEAMSLQRYITTSEELAADPAVSSLSRIIQGALVDGGLDAAEQAELSRSLTHLVDPSSVGDMPCEVRFDGTSFCLTGNFEHGSKDMVSEFITSLGGVMLKSVTKKCDYVVIGDCDCEAYSYGTYGEKVKKAMEWQAKGMDVKIVRESNLPWEN